MTDPLPLAGRAALVTGASGGIGQAVAAELPPPPAPAPCSRPATRPGWRRRPGGCAPPVTPGPPRPGRLPTPATSRPDVPGALGADIDHRAAVLAHPGPPHRLGQPQGCLDVDRERGAPQVRVGVRERPVRRLVAALPTRTSRPPSARTASAAHRERRRPRHQQGGAAAPDDAARGRTRPGVRVNAVSPGLVRTEMARSGGRARRARSPPGCRWDASGNPATRPGPCAGWSRTRRPGSRAPSWWWTAAGHASAPPAPVAAGTNVAAGAEGSGTGSGGGTPAGAGAVRERLLGRRPAPDA